MLGGGWRETSGWTEEGKVIMEQYESWIERAKSSLELAQARIIRHIHYEDLRFQLQQAAEKALKGLLIYYGVEPEFTHNWLFTYFL